MLDQSTYSLVHFLLDRFNSIQSNTIQQIEYLDLRATGLEGEVSPEICAIDFELFKADCGSANDKSSGKMICACCTWCYAIAF